MQVCSSLFDHVITGTHAGTVTINVTQFRDEIEISLQTTDSHFDDTELKNLQNASFYPSQTYARLVH